MQAIQKTRTYRPRNTKRDPKGWDIKQLLCDKHYNWQGIYTVYTHTHRTKGSGKQLFAMIRWVAEQNAGKYSIM